MDKEICLKRNELLKESMELRIILKDPKVKYNDELYKLQNEKWKKYKFFDEFIKTREKIK